ncbi:helix-turn-helix domain-containing protein [Butyrivibrio sp. AE3004]|uniref:helix-turn-helix domain-containing protein n=1 Tax=Butyrivibrio sp. AE3004 TaxID=1506994 RepID=UPI0006920116|nr:helix-turn-helix transcriptional regulator [Butyrivibrio sp. AE3004]
MFDALGRIDDLIISHNMSRNQVAKKANIPSSTLNSYFKFNRYPPIDNIERICDVFGLTLIEFFSDSEQLETGKTTTELAELNSKYVLLADHQKNAVNSVIDAFLTE